MNNRRNTGRELTIARTRSSALPPVGPFAKDDAAGVYFKHFECHVSHVLPGVGTKFPNIIRSSASLYCAVLCLSASSLAMLDAPVQSRQIFRDRRRSVFSPIANAVHYNQARKYHDLAVASLRSEGASGKSASYAAALVTKVLLAIYHHASTDHLKFQMAVDETNHFVLERTEAFTESSEGREALQMWHRLSVSSRTSRRPTLLTEDEANVCSRSDPGFYNAIERLHLTCILDMTSDDLIYDILVKTIELRSRAVVFRTVSGVSNVSDQSQGLGNLAHQYLDRLLGCRSNEKEYKEAEMTFVRGPHLISLLRTQQDRLSVWKSRLDTAQLPPEIWDCESPRSSSAAGIDFPAFPCHRDAMNALYYFLCQIMMATLQESGSLPISPTASSQSYITRLEETVRRMLRILDLLDFSASSTSDVYTFSLAEVLLQLALTWHSSTTFQHILDVTWPRIEAGGRGFEHSHYPTHLAKRVITLIADQLSQGRAVTYASLAVENSVPKLQLLTIGRPVDLMICGHCIDGKYFIQRTSLP
ncbi:hypothetical protein RBB50_010777 [Rhinocladiella similis]